MDQLAAMRDTLALAKKRFHHNNLWTPADVDYAHLSSMLERAEEGAQSGTFSQAKLGRWLGYMQGVLVALGAATLDEMKEINRQHAGPSSEPGPLTHGSFVATPQAAIEAAHLLSLMEHAVQIRAIEHWDLSEVVRQYGDGRLSIDEAIKELEDAIKDVDPDYAETKA